MSQHFFGDNLQVMRGSITDASVDPADLDPPFHSKRERLDRAAETPNLFED